MEKLSNFEPNQKMMEALEADFSDDSLIAADPSFGLYLKSRKLDYDNVSRVLWMLLNIEDISSMHPYSHLIQYDVRINKESRNVYSITPKETAMNVKDVLTPNMDEIVLIPSGYLVAEGILAQMPHENERSRCGSLDHRHVADITYVTPTKVTFALKENDNHKVYCDQFDTFKTYDVVFRAPRVSFCLMYNALNIIENSSNIRRYLFPISDPNKNQAPVSNKLDNFNLYNISIGTNDEQLQAVREIVNGPNPQAPYIVFGPPGTGKTTTIVEAIIQLHMKGCNRILVTAGSNSACDTIALRIIENLQSLKSNQEVNLRRFYSASYNRNNMKNIPPLLKKNSIVLTNKDLDEGQLVHYKIIVATLCSAGRIYTSSYNYRFSHVFIDEAAASTEAEAMMGVVFKNLYPCHIILSGDHKQLGAVIKNDRAASLGLGQSLMERLLLNKLYEVDDSGNYDQTLQTRLRRNYRSHPEIVGIYNKLYYNCELIPLAPLSKVNQAANWSVLPNGKFPILFQATVGATAREAHSTSSYNKLEADVLCWYVLKLLCDGLGNGVKVEQEDIGIVTPYLAQCKLVNSILTDRDQKKVEVGSVESYQGREKTIIIASMVSSFKSTNFLSNPRRVNVMLSRAKSLLILIGNPITLNRNKDFKFIINQCHLNKNFVSQKQVELDIEKHLERKLKEYEEIRNKDLITGINSETYYGSGSGIILGIPINQCKSNQSFMSQRKVEMNIGKPFERKLPDYREMYENEKIRAVEYENKKIPKLNNINDNAFFCSIGCLFVIFVYLIMLFNKEVAIVLTLTLFFAFFFWV